MADRDPGPSAPQTEPHAERPASSPPGIRSRFFVAAPSRALKYLPVTALLLDLTFACGAVLLGIMGRQRLQWFDPGGDIAENVGAAGPLIVLGWVLLVTLAGGYRRDVFDAGTDEYRRVFNASVLTAGLVGVGCYLANYSLARGFFLITFVVGVPAMVLGRFLLRRLIHTARRRGTLLHTVLISGSPAHIDEIASVLRRERWLGYRVVGALTPAHDTDEETPSGVPVLGNTDDLTQIAVAAKADIVFLANGSLSSSSQMRRVAWDLEREAVQVVVAPSVTDVSSERVHIRPVGGLPLIHIEAPRSLDAARWGKRLFDVVFSALLLALTSPFFLVTGLLIMAYDRGPVLFRQTRVGRHGEEFSCLKFRTMVPDAEQRLADLHTEVGYESGLFKMTDDPRITRPGRWLRRYSLDELPQLWNVLRGEMSLVGPRPPLPLEVERYDSATHRRLQVRPGMTGLWQVSGRSDLSWQEAIRLDLYYVDNWSMVQDLTILLRTVGTVLFARGAY